MATNRPLNQRFVEKLPRLAKFSRQWLQCAGIPQRVDTRTIFVLGAQRSGTRLPLHVLEQSPDIITYSEGHSRYFNRVLLKDDETIARRLRTDPFPIVVLKPICESHRALDLLATFPGSKVVWIYRNYRDTANSAALKWTRGVEQLRDLATGNLAAAGWRAGGLSEERFATVRSIYRDDLSAHAAYAAHWWTRTQLFFDMGLDRRADVQLVRYEDLVLEPPRFFPRMFEFIGTPFRSGFLDGVYSSSVKSKAFPAIPEEIDRLCRELNERMDRHYESSVGAV